MAHHTLQRIIYFVALLITTWAEKDQSRWSRQISSYTADISDWVPLPAPAERNIPQIKRQAVAEPRILTEPFPGFGKSNGFNQDGGFNQDAFPSRAFINSPSNRQLYLQSLPAVPSAPQNYLTDQGFGQGIRFGLTQPNFPLSQGFVGPQFAFDSTPQLQTKPQAAPTDPFKFDNFRKTSQPSKSQVQPYNAQFSQVRPETPKFVDGYRAENVTKDFSGPVKQAQSLQKLKYDGINNNVFPHNKPKVEREEVQLLYVPVESLNRGQYNLRNPMTTPQLINSDLYSQAQRQMQFNRPLNQNPTADFQIATTKMAEKYTPRQQLLTNFNYQLTNFDQVPKYTLSSPFPTLPPTTTTPIPKRLKPHQPPLAIFLTQEAKKDNQVRVGDVLYSLKSAETIAVLDSVNPQNAPKVFIGPSTLTPPENYVKFELPYLSNIENSEKKLRQLPFFVAPLSYNTPQGFAKIPFPSPHVGSVVINSQIRETSASSPPTITSSLTNSYLFNQLTHKQKQRIEGPGPNINYYTTAYPETNAPQKQEPNYYSFEQQTVNPLRATKQPQAGLKATSYFLSNIGNQYNPSQNIQFPSGTNYQNQELIQELPVAPTIRTTTTPRATITTTTTTSHPTTTRKPSTYPSQLLETHNPYSINQAFHFSTPIDYQNFFDEYKENYSTPGVSPSLSTLSSSPQHELKPTPETIPVTEEIQTEQPKYLQPSPNYIQSYSPEIQYESESPNGRFTTYDNNRYTTQSQFTPEYNETNSPQEQFLLSSEVTPTSNSNQYTVPQTDVIYETTEDKTPITSSDYQVPLTGPTYNYNQYENNFSSNEIQQSTSSSSTTTTTTTTTTTRRTPTRNRGRPRYPTVKPESEQHTSRTVVTRRPLRERRPLTRPRYETSKTTTEKTTQKATDFSESTTTKAVRNRTRTRGRVHYKPSEADDIYDKRSRTKGKKDNDLAYQRDVLHQNYPVTLMERTSTVDIEAMTEPTIKISSTNHLDNDNHAGDTENAYSDEKISITEHISPIEEIKDTEDTFTISHIKDTFTQNLPTMQNVNNGYEIHGSTALGESYPTVNNDEPKEDTLPKETTLQHTTESFDEMSSESPNPIGEQGINNDQINNEYYSMQQEEITTQANVLNANNANQEIEGEENVVQTTPSYNRVRIRPGVIRQHHQASTESKRAKADRKRPSQTITYRPAYDRRRTTMRIDEIEADLKTKQVHVRPEVHDYKHPVYKPESTSELTVLEMSTQETTTRRGPIRRRRPVYTTTTTERTNGRKNSYDVKHRFRGRRPTEKPTEKSETQTEASSSTTPVVKYNRPRLSERFNNKHDQEESEDQDLNYSIHRPNYALPDSEQWSPKISTDSFIPYNPSEIADNTKITTMDDKEDNSPELDIITAKNEYEDILISVTPASNNKNDKKIPDIPPTLEALVEQSRITKSYSGDTMSTFESMLEEVMKSLEEQDENEYTKNVMKHKGGEIGEIPPEKIITSDDYYNAKATTSMEETTTSETPVNESAYVTEGELNRKEHRRGFWKKVKVRPVTADSIEVAESQYYPNTVNRLGQPVKTISTVHDKSDKYDKSKSSVTTYKPNYNFIKELFEEDNGELDLISNIDIPKITTEKSLENTEVTNDQVQQKTTLPDVFMQTRTQDFNPGDMDLGTGTPDSTFSDSTYLSTVTEAITSEAQSTDLDRSDAFSFMDYLFGVTSAGSDSNVTVKNETTSATNTNDLEVTNGQIRSKTPTTESTYMPDEITAATIVDKEDSEHVFDKQVVNTSVHPSYTIETSSISSYMDPLKIMSTSMSTEISHETEICFRGKCIKTSKNGLL